MRGSMSIRVVFWWQGQHLCMCVVQFRGRRSNLLSVLRKHGTVSRVVAGTTFCDGVVVFVWLCLCGGVGVLLWWCGSVVAVSFLWW